MNLLFGILGHNPLPTPISPNILLSGNLQVTIKSNGILKEYRDEKSGSYCAILGYIANAPDLKKRFSVSGSDAQIIADIFRTQGDKIAGIIKGVYSIIVHDGKQGMIFRDCFGSALPLYYNPGKPFFFSTSLKCLLDWQPSRKLDTEGLLDFMLCRTNIPSERTLVQGVKKLLPGEYLLFSNDTACVRSFRYSATYPSKSMAKEKLMVAIQDSAQNVISLLPEANCTLSGGYDSNLMLFHLAQTGKTIQALTIGGKRINEIEAARSFAARYPNVEHTSSTVPEDALEFFPEIVRLTEGYVFEQGLFLQFELASQLKKRGIHSVLLGECADQILDQHRKTFFARLRFELKDITLTLLGRKKAYETFRESFILKKIRRPSLKVKYDPVLDYILKKNGMMLNGFDIQGYYPFLDETIRNLSVSLGKLNSWKQYYKSQVETLFKNNAVNFKKVGGTTDVEYLFEGKEKLVSRLLATDFAKMILDKKTLRKIESNPRYYGLLILRLFYLYLFNEIFIKQSGESKKLSDYFSDGNRGPEIPN